MEPQMVDRTTGNHAGAAGRAARKSKPALKAPRKKAGAAAGEAAAGGQRGRARALAPAASFLRGAVGDAAAKRGIAETKLLTQWAEIVGEDFASCTQPLELKRRSGLALGGVLTLAVEGARATEIEHVLPQLIERVNAHYGYRAVAEARLTQATDRLRRRPETPARAPRRTATEDERRRVAALTDPIGDGDLRAALARLGENVIVRAAEKRAKSGKTQRVQARADAARPSMGVRARKSSTVRPEDA